MDEYFLGGRRDLLINEDEIKEFNFVNGITLYPGYEYDYGMNYNFNYKINRFCLYYFIFYVIFKEFSFQ